MSFAVFAFYLFAVSAILSGLMVVLAGLVFSGETRVE